MKKTTKMKKSISLFLMLILTVSMSFSVFGAENIGDVLGNIYSTDILTYINDTVVPSYSINGKMLIVAEDLMSYGFDVFYNDEIRCLFVTRNGKKENPICSEARGSIGEITGNYYKSDIRVIFNGEFVTSYSLNGKMAIEAEKLGEASESTDNFGLSRYLMNVKWDENERKLNLYTHTNEFSDTKKALESYKNKDSFGWHYNGEIELEGGKILLGEVWGTSHGDYKYYQYLSDDGIYYLNLNSVLDSYRFRDIWGHIKIENLKACDDLLEFYGTKQDGTKGTYLLNPKNGVIVLNGEEEKDENYEPYPESPIGKEAVTSTVRVAVDGKQIQAYSVLDGTYIDIEDFLDFGFLKQETGRGTVYMKDNNFSKNTKSCEILPSGQKKGILSEDNSNNDIYVNGRLINTFLLDGKRVVNVDKSFNNHYGEGTYCYNLYFKYGVDPCGVIMTFDNEANTVNINTRGLNDEKMFDILKNEANSIFPDMTKTVIADNEEYYIIKYNMNDNYNTEGFLIRNNGDVYNLYEISQAYYDNNVSDMEIKNSALYITIKDGNSLILDINTLLPLN